MFFALLLAISPLRVIAQQPPPATAAASPTAVPLTALAAPPDTAAALRRIFAQRRHRGHTALKVGGATLVVSALLVTSIAHGSGYQELGLYLGGFLGMAGSVPVLATGIVRSISYSKKYEQRTVQTWRQHRLSRRLKGALAADSLLAAQARLAQAVALAASGPVAANALALDTAAALHRLFAAKRRLLRIGLPLTAAVGVGFSTMMATRPFSLGSTGAVVLGTTALLAAGELVTLRKYSKKQEARVLRALQQHRLPATRRQELQADYLRPAKVTP